MLENLYRVSTANIEKRLDQPGDEGQLHGKRQESFCRVLFERLRSCFWSAHLAHRDALIQEKSGMRGRIRINHRLGPAPRRQSPRCSQSPAISFQSHFSKVCGPWWNDVHTASEMCTFLHYVKALALPFLQLNWFNVAPAFFAVGKSNKEDDVQPRNFSFPVTT